MRAHISSPKVAGFWCRRIGTSAFVSRPPAHNLCTHPPAGACRSRAAYFNRLLSLSLSLSLRRPAVNASPLCSRVLLSHPFSPMSLMALREQLNMLVNSMYIEGLLDQQFQQLQMLQDASSPGFVAEVITLFCEDAERILTELTKLVDQAVVEFQKVDAYVHQLKGSSSSVGAQNVKLACIQFRQFCEENNKDGCLNALNVVKHHYYLLRNKFDTMLQLEQRIQAYDSKQQN
ncbi:unnamed protein product [Musa banksii]